MYALMYHDVVDRRAESPYELETVAFKNHLAAIRERLNGSRPVLATASDSQAGRRACVLTFDDGNECAYRIIAPILEGFGWRGHFFIITRAIGRKGVMSAEQIRDLAARGHDIGSHSASHPKRIAHLPQKRIVEEWRESTERLAEILGRPVRTASVPHGDFSPEVATEAAACGIDVLFTSTPTSRAIRIDGCTIYGRFAIKSGTSARDAAAFAEGRNVSVQMRERALWELKSLAKNAAGRFLYRG
jgi:peptidoglycan/xylan/chitin deacetylase (PgdA/CDA1 family)